MLSIISVSTTCHSLSALVLPVGTSKYFTIPSLHASMWVTSCHKYQVLAFSTIAASLYECLLLVGQTRFYLCQLPTCHQKNNSLISIAVFTTDDSSIQDNLPLKGCTPNGAPCAGFLASTMNHHNCSLATGIYRLTIYFFCGLTRSTHTHTLKKYQSLAYQLEQTHIILCTGTS